MNSSRAEMKSTYKNTNNSPMDSNVHITRLFKYLTRQYLKEYNNMPQKKLNLQPRASTTKQIYSFYTEPQLDTIKDIYNTYNNRGGELEFTPFAMIPINKDPGDMNNERGEWTKFIRNRLAHEWESMKVILSI